MTAHDYEAAQGAIHAYDAVTRMYDGSCQHALFTHKFTGKERDSETGLDNFGARYNSSSFGRFLSPDEPDVDQDPANPQSWNLYSFVRNNPLNATDPNGRYTCVYLNDAGTAKESTDPNSSAQECSDTGGQEAVPDQQVTVTADAPPPTLPPASPDAYTRLYNYLRSTGLYCTQSNPCDVRAEIPITFGPVAGALGAGSEIAITAERLKHVVDLHSILKLGPNGKSAFVIGEDIVKLIKDAKDVAPVAQAGGNFERVVDAGRIVGVTRDGIPTTTYTVITNVKNELVTAFPGKP